MNDLKRDYDVREITPHWIVISKGGHRCSVFSLMTGEYKIAYPGGSCERGLTEEEVETRVRNYLDNRAV